MSKKRLGMFVVALIMVLLLALGYYYSDGQGESGSTVLVAVRGYLSVEQMDALTTQLGGYASEEGKPVTLHAIEFPATTPADVPNVEISQKMSELVTALNSGETNLLLLDRFVFELLGDEQLFEDLSARYPSDAAVSGKYLYTVAGKPFANADGLQDLPEVYFALRNGQSAPVNKNSQTLKKYALQSELLDHIAGSVPSEGFSAIGLKD